MAELRRGVTISGDELVAWNLGGRRMVGLSWQTTAAESVGSMNGVGVSKGCGAEKLKVKRSKAGVEAPGKMLDLLLSPWEARSQHFQDALL